jgi:hypothetical protein
LILTRANFERENIIVCGVQKMTKISKQHSDRK